MIPFQFKDSQQPYVMACLVIALILGGVTVTGQKLWDYNAGLREDLDRFEMAAQQSRLLSARLAQLPAGATDVDNHDPRIASSNLRQAVAQIADETGYVLDVIRESTGDDGTEGLILEGILPEIALPDLLSVLFDTAPDVLVLGLSIKRNVDRFGDSESRNLAIQMRVSSADLMRSAQS